MATASCAEHLDETSATHHHMVASRRSSNGTSGEDIDESSLTRHETRHDADDLAELKISDADGDITANKISEQQRQQQQQFKKSATALLNKRVAEYATKAYNKAVANSKILKKESLDNNSEAEDCNNDDVAMVKFHELKIGKFLGNGSFSDVHEIIKVDAATSSSEGSSNNTTIIDQQTLAAITPTASQSQTEIKNARLLLSLHYQRSDGGYRYAIKYLKSNVISTPEKYLIGTVDLVIEGMFLSSLSHPNIIKLRGLPQGGIMSLCNDDDDNNNNSSDNNGGGGGVSNNMGYFLVLDRLYDTLGDRIYDDWKINHVQIVRKAGLFGMKKNKDDILDQNEDISIRLKVAMDMSAAIKYLHEKNIIYRDLKPENLGFDVRDDIKLFDLGLVKELHVADKKNDGTYNLSLAGTPRYMAPEVGLYMPYNLSADVYSITMLLWEMMTLNKPFEGYSYNRLKKEIFSGGMRPELKQVKSKVISELISNGWHANPKKRPTIDMVYEIIKKEYIRLAPHVVTENEVTHHRRRSTFVVRSVKRPSPGGGGDGGHGSK